MRHGSLESGIGMFDYAAEMMGWENIFHCEINEFCRTILKYYWPKAKSYANVFEFNGTEWRGKVDIITAGFPCQPFSNAGKRKGSEDDRHIWPENMRIFREAQPAFIVCENVPGLVTIEDGMVFEQVCSDLENEGYEVQTFIIPAVATDKYHRRDRIWIVAHPKKYGGCRGSKKLCQENGRQDGELLPEPIDTISLPNTNPDRYGHGYINRSGQDTGTKRESESEGDKREWIRSEFRRNDSVATDTKFQGLQESKVAEQQQECLQHERYNSNATDTRSERQPGQGEYRGQLYSEANGIGKIYRTINGNKLKETWLEAATRLCTVDDGYSGRLDTTAISKSKWRTESLKAAGNTIVWEIAFEIFKATEETMKTIQL